MHLGHFGPFLFFLQLLDTDETVTGIDSILQSLIDRYKDAPQLKLVLCGSYVEIMKSLLARESPLYGRVDLTIDLEPTDYYESVMFYPTFSSEDKMRLYSVFGGIPYYNRLVDPVLSVRENIIELPFDKTGKYYFDDSKTRTNGEYDTVAVDLIGYVFYESKFHKEPVSLAMIHEEIKQLQTAG